ncbi:DUF2637 domain-containing protein [Kitasatospora sp. NBC_01287]|uniref:DUF2637 domain-containing protein n=1 Tax=Kitasatospora sp. NBC_01287 TaxID=2903573 RepID=UPI0022589225|nr:DUF2637 domain-containing protein [Kitasatospora sp. NBC_01287]MCX4750924.1 DUF2637 domain-containing protein [Kitasatospora sp. NBC_01287]MCX4751825.1 DUF2637 domain-containing protein [Kitasatospora sp. NBC_01287]MCX4751883.1 DUF2637 domain-containing protein [Kitasatospora sp. NBC_01287]
MTAHRERLALGAALVIIALTVAAFWLSYAHLHAVAAAHGLGQSPARSWAWPATLDLFIVAGELLMLRASLARATDWWAIGLTVVGSGGSIALNVFGVGGHDPLAYVTAAVPPTAALLAFGALMRQVHSLLSDHDEVTPVDHESAYLPSATDAASVALQRSSQSATPGAAKAPRTSAPATTRSAPATATMAPWSPAQSATQGATVSLVKRSQGAAQSAPVSLTKRHQSAPTPPVVAPPQRPAPATTTATKAPRPAATKRPKGNLRDAARDAIKALYETNQKRPLESEMVAALKAAKLPHSRQFANARRLEIEKDDPALAALGSQNVRPLTGS